MVRIEIMTEQSKFIERNDSANYLALAAAGLTIIRNIANNRTAEYSSMPNDEKLQLIAKLSQILHCIPSNMTDETRFQRELLQSDLQEFLLEYPQYYGFLCRHFGLPEKIMQEIKSKLKQGK